MLLIGPLHQHRARLARIPLPPKGGEDRIPIFDPVGNKFTQVVCPGRGMEANMADHQRPVAECNRSEEPGLEGRVLLELGQPNCDERLFLKPLRGDSKPKERLSDRNLALKRGFQKSHRQGDEV